MGARLFRIRDIFLQTWKKKEGSNEPSGIGLKKTPVYVSVFTEK
jgi:hypothetical protein